MANFTEHPWTRGILFGTWMVYFVLLAFFEEGATQAVGVLGIVVLNVTVDIVQEHRRTRRLILGRAYNSGERNSN
jgi:hypothetical protein